MKIVKNGWPLGFTVNSDSQNEYGAPRFDFATSHLVIPRTLGYRGKKVVFAYWWYGITNKKDNAWMIIQACNAKTAQGVTHRFSYGWKGSRKGKG
jgi:hypothetical protein